MTTAETSKRRRVQCRRCSFSRLYFLSQLRALKSYDPETGTYLCRACQIRDLTPKAAEPKLRPCAYCGQDFKPRHPDSKYCSPDCGFNGRAAWRIDNNLKARFVGQLRSRRIRLSVAAEEAGMSGLTLSSWLRRPGGRLRRRNIEASAAWLGIPVTEALQLQGGASEARRRSFLQAHMKKVQEELDSSHPGWRKRAVKAAQDAVTGKPRKPFTAEHRAKLSASMKSAYERGTAFNVRQYSRSLRGRASRIMSGLRRGHPDWSRREIEEAAVERLLGPRFNIGDEKIARALVHSPGPESRGGRPAQVDYWQVMEWRMQNVKWIVIAARLQRDPEVLRIGYTRWRRAPKNRNKPPLSRPQP